MAPRAAPQVEPGTTRREATAAPRLPLGAAVLVIATLSGALWFGIIRLLNALF